ncbi:hypothetical protein [Candidatus Culexarchaeum yellowstonense]|uniref:hypothetical protein n=1 Tax=Candidatus Culexarchaeum yellowstonense TaxID=2928963 RepID=UPI0026E9A200|nr:hypothetical protein [Candidatus Culexarchaeum yellowstonense]
MVMVVSVDVSPVFIEDALISDCTEIAFILSEDLDAFKFAIATLNNFIPRSLMMLLYS